MNVDTVWQAGLSLATRLPVLALPPVSSPIHWNHIQKEQVAGLRIQASDRHSASREHAPAQGRARKGEGWSYPLAQVSPAPAKELATGTSILAQ